MRTGELRALLLMVVLSTGTATTSQAQEAPPSAAAGLEESLSALPWTGATPHMREILREAAEQGDPRAMANLAVAYVNGQGGPKDEALARYWYERAAKARSDHGVYGLGLLLANGQGGPPDVILGLALLQLAEAAGDTQAAVGLDQIMLSADEQAVVEEAKRRWVATYGAPCIVVSGVPEEKKAWSLVCDAKSVAP